MEPIVNGLESEFAGQITIIRLNAEEPANANLQAEYGLRGHPTFAVIDSQGEVVQRFIGPQTEETLRQALVAIQPQN